METVNLKWHDRDICIEKDDINTLYNSVLGKMREPDFSLNGELLERLLNISEESEIPSDIPEDTMEAYQMFYSWIMDVELSMRLAVILTKINNEFVYNGQEAVHLNDIRDDLMALINSCTDKMKTPFYTMLSCNVFEDVIFDKFVVYTLHARSDKILTTTNIITFSLDQGSVRWAGRRK